MCVGKKLDEIEKFRLPFHEWDVKDNLIRKTTEKEKDAVYVGLNFFCGIYNYIMLSGRSINEVLPVDW